jgi:DNA-binding transcriptional MerR regulator
MVLQELKQELDKRIRQLKNADPEQIGFLKKKIARLEEEIQSLEPQEQPEVLKEFVLTVSGKKIKFNKAGVCNLEYGSLLKRVDQSHYIIMYGSKTDKDAELVYTDGKWKISCCDAASFPNFKYEDLGLAITYLLDYMHDKYSGVPQEEVAPVTQIKAEIPIDIIEEVQKKPRKKKMSAELEDVNELRRYIEILDEILATSKSTSVKNQIESEKIEVQELIDEIESQN